MKKLAALLLLLFAGNAAAQQLAFPTAMGFGKFTVGGRGGKVCHVNTTSGSTTGAVVPADASRGIEANTIYEGSLTYCYSAVTGPRMIVFNTSGTIDHPDLFARDTEQAGDPNITVACQSAPSPGVSFLGQFLVDQSQVIMRHCRHRSEGVATNFGALVVGEQAQAGSGGDTIPKDVIVDHYSVAYASDNNISVSIGSAQGWPCSTNRSICKGRITAQRGISAWALGDLQGSCGNGTPTANGSCSTIQGGIGISFIQNAFVHNARRNTAMQSGELEVVNNIVYNWGTADGPGYAGAYYDVSYFSWLNNYHIEGPQSDTSRHRIYNTVGTSTDRGNSLLWASGNLHTTHRPTDTGAESLWFQGTLFGTWTYDVSPTYTTADGLGFTQLDDELVLPASGLIAAAQASTGWGPWANSSGTPFRDTIDTDALADIDVSALTDGRIEQYACPTSQPACGTVDATTTAPGYPVLAVNVHAASGANTCANNGYDGWDTDCDGMPDAWEATRGLDASNAADGALISANGYSNLENYLNDLAGDDVPGLSPDVLPPDPITGISLGPN